MANVEPVAPTIDFEALLQPIPGDNPSGQSMQYSETLLYDKIRAAREADDPTLSQGQWQTELKVADFRQVINLSTDALTKQTKDLQIAVWFCEALTSINGFAGFRDGLQLIRRLEEDFWDTLYPVEELDEEDEEGNPKYAPDQEGRANAIDWMNSQISLALKKIPFTLGDGFNYNQWEESTRFDVPEDLESYSYEEQNKFKEIKAQAETENRKTGDQWRKASKLTNRAFAETLYLTLDECFTELNALDQTNEEKFDRNQVPAVNELKKIIGNITSVAKTVLDAAREREPDEEDEQEVVEVTGEDGEVVVKKGPGVATGAIQSRQDALKRLSDVAAYFRKNEPHSPVSYLVQRAVKWGNMSLEVWFEDVIKDDSVIEQLRQTLGFNTDNSSEEEEE